MSGSDTGRASFGLEHNLAFGGEALRCPVRAIFDRFDQDCPPIHGCFDPKAEPRLSATNRRDIFVAVMDAEQRRALRKRPESLWAWEAYQRGPWYLGQFVPRTGNERAREFFRNSVAVDPMFTSAYPELAVCDWIATWPSCSDRAS